MRKKFILGLFISITIGCPCVALAQQTINTKQIQKKNENGEVIANTSVKFYDLLSDSKEEYELSIRHKNKISILSFTMPTNNFLIQGKIVEQERGELIYQSLYDRQSIASTPPMLQELLDYLDHHDLLSLVKEKNQKRLVITPIGTVDFSTSYIEQ